MAPITFATIGTGWITTSWIQAAHATGAWQLSAVYSRTAESAQDFAAKHNCSKTYTSLSDLAADSSIQALYIASPNSSHYEQAKQFLQAKKHVILEKPATSTSAELDELFALAKERGVFLIEAFRHIQEANFKVLKKYIVDEQKLGKIYGASFQYAQYSSRYTNVLNGEVPNIFSLDFSGGSLVDVGVYPVTFAVALFGKPKRQVYAPFICPSGVDGGGSLLLQYEWGGVHVNNAKGYTSTAPNEIWGEKGTVTVNFSTDLSTIKHWDPRTKETKELAGPCKTVEKPNVNMEEECEEHARIINEKDIAAAEDLERISKIVIGITEDCRRQNGLLYPADKK